MVILPLESPSSSLPLKVVSCTLKGVTFIVTASGPITYFYNFDAEMQSSANLLKMLNHIFTTCPSISMSLCSFIQSQCCFPTNSLLQVLHERRYTNFFVNDKKIFPWNNLLNYILYVTLDLKVLFTVNLGKEKILFLLHLKIKKAMVDCFQLTDDYVRMDFLLPQIQQSRHYSVKTQ